MPKVLHITAHMGGGVGKVLSGVTCCAKKLDSNYKHEILLLERPENSQFVDICKKAKVPVYLKGEVDAIKLVESADIVQIEWWQHPVTAKFMFELSSIPVRLLVWSHVSGCNYPYLPAEFVKLPERFMFTSPYSLENDLWKDSDLQTIKGNSQVVTSSGGFEDVLFEDPVPHRGFNVGYVGTLDFIKMHPRFIDFCAHVDVPETSFIVVGDADNRLELEREAQEKGIYDKLEFVGYTKNVKEQLARFDVFGYLLNPDHYGTGENALLEAMAAGLPVVVLNQCTEKHTVKHMETGILVNNQKEYGEAIRFLYENPEERKRIGSNAREYILSEFSVQKTVDKLHSNYDKVIRSDKKMYDFDQVFGSEPYEWFLAGLNREGVYFRASMKDEYRSDSKSLEQIERKIANARLILRGKNKSSVYQFSRYFPEDSWLQYWSEIMDNFDYEKES